METMKETLILASRSPRRSVLLKQLGIPHRIKPSSVEETRREGEPAEAYAERLAIEKALDVSRRTTHPALGADTIVVVDERILEQPRDDEEAFEMLSQLSARTHRVVTGLALALEGKLLGATVSVTEVRFRALEEGEIRRYIASGEGRDKAGSYGVQGLGGGLIERIEGEYGTVVGLPLSLTIALLREHGVLQEWPLEGTRSAELL